MAKFDPARLLDAGMDDELVSKLERAWRTVKDLVERDTVVSVAWSGGKDSTVALILSLLAFEDAQRPGVAGVPLVVTTADTGIENPVVYAYWVRMVRTLRSYAKARGLDVRVRIARPSLVSSWTVKVVSGCGLPTFQNSKSRKCSIDLKRTPAVRSLRRLVPELQAELDARLDKAPPDFLRLSQLRERITGAQPVVVVGTRYGESAERDRRMAARGDTTAVRANEDGTLVLPLIADFALEDVWETLALAGSADGKPLPSFAASFDATRDLYRDASGECVIVAGTKDASSACGARFGCSLCTAVGRDRSMETLLEKPENAFMRPLHRLREFLLRTQNDLGRRRWVGRTFHPLTGHVKVQPDGYSSAMVEELLGIMLSIDAEEAARADALAQAAEEGAPWPDPHLTALAKEGKTDPDYLARMVRPQFRLVSEEQLILIDFLWSRYGVHRPFRALWIRQEIEKGRRWDIPAVEESEPAPFPATRWLAVPTTPYHTPPLFDDLDWALRDRPGVSLPAITDKTVTVDPEETETIEVFTESAAFILDYEADGLIALYHDGGYKPMAAVHYYLRFGAIGVPKGRLAEIGAVAERNLRLIECGLDPALPYDALPIERSLSDSEHAALAKAMAAAPDPANPASPGKAKSGPQMDLFTHAA